ncbi:unnamed protein product, partial [Polarella glacialis]
MSMPSGTRISWVPAVRAAAIGVIGCATLVYAVRRARQVGADDRKKRLQRQAGNYDAARDPEPGRRKLDFTAEQHQNDLEDLAEDEDDEDDEDE